MNQITRVEILLCLNLTMLKRAVYINQESAHHISENQLQTLFEGSSKAFSTFPEPSDGTNTILFMVLTHRIF